MPDSSTPKSSSPLLPLHISDSPRNSLPGERSPTAFISYSHGPAEHDKRVLDLAERLRSDGVTCEIDAFEVSPSEGWPLWMQRHVQESIFVIVVCTETYARRFAGKEASGKGKGATLEGWLINQSLYEVGKNHRFIPIVFEEADVDHIPLVLRGATYYNLSTDSGYNDLHRALTNQPRIARRPVGPVRKRLPDLDPAESTATALLYSCPDPLPLEVVARVLGQDPATVVETLKRLVQIAVVKIEKHMVRREAPSGDDIPSLSDNSFGIALEAALDFVENHRNASGRAQMMNVVTLARSADIHTSAAPVSRTFQTIQSFLKSSGDKRLVLEVARRSIEASKVKGRRHEQVEDEAVAAICGVSWVYQRTGRLAEALAEAERSFELGSAIRWDRNTAFCHKCIGRLKRMEAEATQDRHQRAALLKESSERLRKAIGEFTKLALEAEVGDCYSLLARTHLVSDDRRAAREALKEADVRLVDPATKDYLDLQIVKGDFMLHTDRRTAESMYSEVLEIEGTNGDAQKSEIIARAYLQRGKVRSDLGDKEKALNDFQQAANIWDNLKDPTADFAQWEIERTEPWVDKEVERLLAGEPVGVRVRAARIIREETTGRRVARSHREGLSQHYLRGIISQAKERWAVEQPVW